MDAIKKNNLPYRYVGGGQFLVEGKNPDFIRTDDKKICIEVGNVYHHTVKYPDWVPNRLKHFEKNGWKCICIITDYLSEHKILKILKNENALT